MLLLPVDYEPGRRYPVWSYVYGGPHAPVVHNRWGGRGHMLDQYLAQRGFIVWACDPRSASGQGAISAWQAQAQQRYGAQLLPVCLQVNAAILRRRLQDRGRESAEQIEQRLARAAEYQQSLPAGCRVLHNDGPLDDTLAALLALLPTATRQAQDATP